MSPRKRTDGDTFEDQTTSRFTPDGTPKPFEDVVTKPIDMAEMKAAAEASKKVPDPNEPPRIVRRDALGSGNTPPLPYAEVVVAGTAEVSALPAHNISRTGVVLEVADDDALAVTEGATVMVRLHLGHDSDGNPVELRLPATVGHRRRGSARKTGGIALRWEGATAEENAALERALAAIRNDK